MAALPPLLLFSIILVHRDPGASLSSDSAPFGCSAGTAAHIEALEVSTSIQAYELFTNNDLNPVLQSPTSKYEAM